jgi:hypothetical protein
MVQFIHIIDKMLSVVTMCLEMSELVFLRTSDSYTPCRVLD